MGLHQSMLDYYSRRAPAYDAIWQRDDPARQAEQQAMAEMVRQAARDRSVLEVACGTGYWTQFAAETARRVLAVDGSEAMLRQAWQRSWPEDVVTFRRGDAYRLDDLPGEEFEAGLAMFWLSHVARARLGEFLDRFHRRLRPGSPVVMADNCFVPGVGGELIVRPDTPDTFKRRILGDGSEHLVVKNYYRREDLAVVFGDWRSTLKIHVGDCFWWIRYRV